MTRYAITFTCPTTGVERTWVGEYESQACVEDHGYGLADKGEYSFEETTLPLSEYEEFWEELNKATPWDIAMLKIDNLFTFEQAMALQDIFDLIRGDGEDGS